MNIRLKDAKNKRIFNFYDIYEIMQLILSRENKVDQNREHLWTISLNSAHKILNIELVSMGSVKKTVVEPMEVFSVPLQKRAVKLILVHNHPSGDIIPLDDDKDVTDRLIQVGFIMDVPVIEHLIIGDKIYYSFAEQGLLA